jgi:predicted RNase H-like nuclease (RuvC/YqgF family)
MKKKIDTKKELKDLRGELASTSQYYERRLAQVEEVIVQLRDENQGLDKENQGLDKEIDRLRQTISKLNEDLRDSVRKDFCLKAIAAAAGNSDNLPF